MDRLPNQKSKSQPLHRNVTDPLKAPKSTDALTRLTVVSRTTDPSLIFDRVEKFVSDYVVLQRYSSLVITAWVFAAYLDLWDRFPHLLIYSPEKRCGKSLLLQVLEEIVPRPKPTQFLTPAVLYRLIERDRPTLLIDEAQDLNRKGAGEASVAVRNLISGSISRNATVQRCRPKGRGIEEFHTFCPKVIAHIGKPDDVLGDRCLTVELRRKLEAEECNRFRIRKVQARSHKLREILERWAEHESRAKNIYADLEPFNIGNDRMADLLMPLQTVLIVTRKNNRLRELQAYANSIDERDRKEESQSWPVRMLVSCKAVFDSAGNPDFLPTADLLRALNDMEEEPWPNWNKGEGLNAHGLGRLLGNYDIDSSSNGKVRGYKRRHFEDAWQRYAP